MGSAPQTTAASALEQPAQPVARGHVPTVHVAPRRQHTWPRGTLLVTRVRMQCAAPLLHVPGQTRGHVNGALWGARRAKAIHHRLPRACRYGRSCCPQAPAAGLSPLWAGTPTELSQGTPGRSGHGTHAAWGWRGQSHPMQEEQLPTAASELHPFSPSPFPKMHLRVQPGSGRCGAAGACPLPPPTSSHGGDQRLPLLLCQHQKGRDGTAAAVKITVIRPTSPSLTADHRAAGRGTCPSSASPGTAVCRRHRLSRWRLPRALALPPAGSEPAHLVWSLQPFQALVL